MVSWLLEFDNICFILDYILGLFQKAISQSGCALNPLAQERGDITVHLASILDLKASDEKEILERLMVLPVDKLYEIYEKVAMVS
jgi:hypothetical protein